MSNERDQEKLLAQWLTGELSDQERSQLEQEEGLDELRFALDDVEQWRVPEMNTLKGLADVKQRIAKQPEAPPKQVFFQPWMRYAAAIVLIAAAVFIFRILSPSGPLTISTGIGEFTSHVLPDGSKVDIDAVSSITYETKGWEDDRKINMEGRALFIVQKGSDFEVISKSGSVKVLGTVFEVNDRGSTFGVRCFEGKVSVETGGQNEILTPGQGIIVGDSGLERIEFNMDAPGWIGKELNYKEIPVSDVLEDLKRYHDVEIEWPQDQQDLPFTGKVPANDLDAILTSLSLVFDLEYTRSDNTIVFK